MFLHAKLLAAVALCPTPLALHPQNPDQQPPESGTVLQLRVNAVLVPVVVRDAQGRAIGDLKEDDFKVFDQGKPRRLSAFTVESGEALEGSGQPAGAASSAVAIGATPAPAPAQPAASATRSIVFLFDDRHMSVADLAQMKLVASHMLDAPLPDGTRAVVLSFLGVNSGLTHDHSALQATIAKLKARQSFQQDPGQCPQISYYAADQIVNKHNQEELQNAVEKTANCAHVPPPSGPVNVAGPPPKSAPSLAEQLARNAINQSLITGQQDARDTLDYIRDVVHTMSKLPGQRTLILVSPGFLIAEDEAMVHTSWIVDMAAAANVTISTLDARGLYGDGISASESGAGSLVATMTGQTPQDNADAMRQNMQVMSTLADGTGGTFFHNNNDLLGGLRALTAGPEYRYLLEFSIQDVKPNGAYHPLKVEVERKDVRIQAREGYFAPLPPKSTK